MSKNSGFNAGSGGGSLSCGKTPQERMRYYDSLPKTIRRFVADASADYESRQFKKAWKRYKADGYTIRQFVEMCRERDEKQRQERQRELTSW